MATSKEDKIEAAVDYELEKLLPEGEKAQETDSTGANEAYTDNSAGDDPVGEADMANGDRKTYVEGRS